VCHRHAHADLNVVSVHLHVRKLITYQRFQGALGILDEIVIPVHFARFEEDKNGTPTSKKLAK
jgi:hypothetical protein